MQRPVTGGFPARQIYWEMFTACDMVSQLSWSSTTAKRCDEMLSAQAQPAFGIAIGCTRARKYVAKPGCGVSLLPRISIWPSAWSDGSRSSWTHCQHHHPGGWDISEQQTAVRIHRRLSDRLADTERSPWRELSTVQWLLEALKNKLRRIDYQTLAEGMRICLQDFKPSMEACSKACYEFRGKVAHITSHSTEDQISWRDKARLQFEEKGITAFKHRIGSHKSTINIALGLLTFLSSDQNRETLQELQNNITTAMSEISGQMEGLDIGIQSLSSAAISGHYGAVVDTLEAMKLFVVLTTGKSGLVSKMSAHNEGRQALFDKVREGGESELVKEFFRD
ncbi:uncharacterized protein TRUGW13939_06988 [Talaromyces rugulosus]|uniref:Azaphilone pigments biosynthesis cluster protein L N-terminal domain-containing protein n=1 Tax=Talaromyces rugulosus TaxID=121627 RepID=A0A7H8R1B9_TALRU|nr:uncharacterized protein TRUGW13939_06988 [Talaromyces rugulosus]QKX59846.1 hypothetical protein TRUGW13939_06988 [Talaromyces rugulosus]